MVANVRPMSLFVPLSIGFAGILLLVPGAFFIPSLVYGLRSEDVRLALEPLSSVQLDRIEAEHSVVTELFIPDTRQWKRIRREWGFPEFIISAVSPAKRFAYCLADLGTTLQVSHQGEPIPLELSHPAYGYSSDCAVSSFRFRATPGAELRFAAEYSGERPLPSGELVISCGWPNMKDKLVGIRINEEFGLAATAISILGLVLIGLCAYLLLGRRPFNNARETGSSVNELE